MRTLTIGILSAALSLPLAFAAQTSTPQTNPDNTQTTKKHKKSNKKKKAAPSTEKGNTTSSAPSSAPATSNPSPK